MKINDLEMNHAQWAEFNENPIIKWYLQQLNERKKIFENIRDNAELEERVSRAAIHRVQGINDAIEVWQGVGHFLDTDAAFTDMVQKQNADYVPDENMDAQSEEALYA